MLTLIVLAVAACLPAGMAATALAALPARETVERRNSWHSSNLGGATPSKQAKPSSTSTKPPKARHDAQESGGCRDPYNATGDCCRSRGAYQFGLARWKEVSTARYPGTPAEQDAAMRSAIARYLRGFHGTTEAQVKRAAYRHNGSGPAARRYAERIWRRYISQR